MTSRPKPLKFKRLSSWERLWNVGDVIELLSLRRNGILCSPTCAPLIDIAPWKWEQMITLASGSNLVQPSQPPHVGLQFIWTLEEKGHFLPFLMKGLGLGPRNEVSRGLFSHVEIFLEPAKMWTRELSEEDDFVPLEVDGRDMKGKRVIWFPWFEVVHEDRGN